MEIAMKMTLITLLFLCTTAAFGQTASVISNEPQLIQLSSHQQRASQQSMQIEQNLLVTSGNYNNANSRGERPLWEVGAKPPAEVPLGDVARLLRNQHATARKAVKILNQ
jgi:hypothetical protein